MRYTARASPIVRVFPTALCLLGLLTCPAPSAAVDITVKSEARLLVHSGTEVSISPITLPDLIFLPPGDYTVRFRWDPSSNVLVPVAADPVAGRPTPTPTPTPTAGARGTVRVRTPLLTERYFLAVGGSAGVSSLAFSYPPTWSVQTQPPGLQGVVSATSPQAQQIIAQGFEVLIAPRTDPQQVTHIRSGTLPLRQGILDARSALQGVIQQRFSNFRLVNEIPLPSSGIPGVAQSQLIAQIYEASYQSVPVSGILAARTDTVFDPMFGTFTIATIFELQIATGLPEPELLEHLQALGGIVKTSEAAREPLGEEVSRGWINALGGVSEARDPSTGQTYFVGNQYSYWWRVGDELVGTNDPAFSGGTRLDVSPAQPRR